MSESRQLKRCRMCDELYDGESLLAMRGGFCSRPCALAGLRAWKNGELDDE